MMELDPLQNILDCADMIRQARTILGAREPAVRWLAQISEMDHAAEIQRTLQALALKSGS